MSGSLNKPEKKGEDSLNPDEKEIESLAEDMESKGKLSPDPAKSNRSPAEKKEAVSDNEDDEPGNDSSLASECTDEADFVDEEALKDRELSLTDDMKEIMKSEAAKMKEEGNNLYKAGEYGSSQLQYTRGLNTCPLAFSQDRAILYSNRAAAKIKLNNNQSAVHDCHKAVGLDPFYTRARIRRAHILEELREYDEALEDWSAIMKMDPLHQEANIQIQRLSSMIAERNKKLKSEITKCIEKGVDYAQSLSSLSKLVNNRI